MLPLQGSGHTYFVFCMQLPGAVLASYGPLCNSFSRTAAAAQQPDQQKAAGELHFFADLTGGSGFSAWIIRSVNHS